MILKIVAAVFILSALWIFLFSLVVAKSSGVMHIDLTDNRKDLVNLELQKDLDEIIKHRYVIFRVDEKHEADFFKGEKK